MRRTRTPATFEVHEHTPVKNKATASWPLLKPFTHSHEDGSRGHRHAVGPIFELGEAEFLEMGPASFVIDAKDWAALTGLKGGGKKKYTKEPDGIQFPRYVELTHEQSHFEVIFADGGYTPDIAKTISEADWLAMRDQFIQATDGPLPESDAPPDGRGTAVARMMLAFDLIPIYVYEKASK